MTAPHDELTTPLVDPAFYAGDPFPLYARLRAEAPLAWNDTLGFWVASRHAEVTAISRDTDTFCSGRGIMVFEIGSRYDTPPTMMHTDPPDHTRYRALVQPGFRPTFIRGLEDGVRARTRALVDRIEPGVPVDVVPELAVPLPLQVISDLLGIPEDEWPRFFRWSEAAIPGATDWPEEERQALSAEMVQYLLAAAAERRASPGEDIISELAAATSPGTGAEGASPGTGAEGASPGTGAEGASPGTGAEGGHTEDGDRLSDAELAMFLVQLLVAGNETTRNMMSGGLLGLAGRPGQWAALRERVSAAVPRAVPVAVEEMLRWTTPVVAFMRTATRPVELAGRAVAAGDPVLMLYASANRDESVFGDDAERFDAARDPNPHVAFGFGAHFCIGAVLARLEGRVLLEELLARFGSIEVAGPVVRTGSPIIAGVRSAPVVFGPR